MANANWRHPANTEVAQVETFTITADSTSNTAVWTFTLTLSDGTTETASYTEDGSPTTTEIATGLYNAWNASTKPNISRITAANPSAGVVTLTSDTAGRPFSVALADDDDGTHTQSTTTANVGNNDVGLAQNWSTDAVLTNTNDLIIEPGSVALKYTLDQSAVALADVKVMKGMTGDIGRFEDGKFFYFRIDPDTFDFRGGGSLSLFDIGSANIPVYVEGYGSASVDGRWPFVIKGSNITTATFAKGKCAIAPFDADTATVATVVCGLLENPQSDVDLTVGSGVTMTTLNVAAGKCLLKCAGTTVNIYKGGVLTTEGTGAITTVNVYEGATFYPKSTGTITTLNVWGTVDFTRNLAAKTVTTLNLKKGGKFIKHDAITITTLAGPSSSGGSYDTVQAA